MTQEVEVITDNYTVHHRLGLALGCSSLCADLKRLL